MSTPLDYFEHEPPKATPLQLQRVVGCFYGSGLMLLNVVLEALWWDLLDEPSFALFAGLVVVGGVLLLSYAVYVLVDFFVLGLWGWVCRLLRYKGWLWRCWRWTDHWWTALTATLLGQAGLLGYLLVELFLK